MLDFVNCFKMSYFLCGLFGTFIERYSRERTGKYWEIKSKPEMM